MACRTRMPADEQSGDPRFDLGAFGGVVMATLVGLVVSALAAVALVEASTWPLALFAVAALVLWARLVR